MLYVDKYSENGPKMKIFNRSIISSYNHSISIASVRNII